MTFGISGGSLPISQADCTVKTDYFVERIEKRQEQEQEMAQRVALNPNAAIAGTRPNPSIVIVIPGPFDVLLGRGKLSQENVGNLRYRNLISSYQERYESVRKAEKTSIADEVVQVVKQCSGRFLKEHNADFVEVSDTKAREKVSHSFRSLRNHASKNRNGGQRRLSTESVSSVSTTTTSSTTESGRQQKQPYKSDDNSVTKRARAF